MSSSFEFYSLGTLAEDVKQDDPVVRVHLMEKLPTSQGDTSAKTNNSGSFTTVNGGVDNFTSIKSSTVMAKYIPFAQPNSGIPMLHSGEMVLICRYGGGDHFMWIPCSNSIKDRTTENFLLMASAKGGRGSTAGSSDTYYIRGDSKAKYIRMHTSKANGEVAELDIELDGANGKITITDDLGNDILIESVAGKMSLTAANDVLIKSSASVTNETKAYTVNCSSFTVTNGANELIDVLSQLVTALSNEVHIDSLGGDTRLSGDSKAKYDGIKSKLESFKA